jgi:hypothetical protein
MDDEHYYYQNYEPSPAEARRQAEASATLVSQFFRLLFRVFVLFILFVPGFFCAYLVLRVYGRLLGNPTDWNYFWWLIGLVITAATALPYRQSMGISRNSTWKVPPV